MTDRQDRADVRQDVADDGISSLAKSTEILATRVGDLATGLVGQGETLRRLRNATIAVACVSILGGVTASVVVYEEGHHQVRKLESHVQESRHDSCVINNKAKTVQAAQTRSAFMVPLDRERAEAHPDPVILGILNGLAHFQAQLSICPPK